MFSTHANIAAFTKIPECALEKPEAEKLASAAANVARWYETPAIAQKTLDWIMLLQTVSAMYGPRIGAYRLRRMLETVAKRDAAQKAAAARQGVPTVETNNRPATSGAASPSAPQAPQTAKRPNGKPPPLSASPDLTPGDGGERGLSNLPLAMITPEGGFTN